MSVNAVVVGEQQGYRRGTHDEHQGPETYAKEPPSSRGVAADRTVQQRYLGAACRLRRPVLASPVIVSPLLRLASLPGSII